MFFTLWGLLPRPLFSIFMFSVPDRSVWGSSLSAGQGVKFLKHKVLKAQNLWHTHCWAKTGPLGFMFDIPATDEISFAILLLNRLTIWTSELLQGNKPSPFLFRKTLPIESSCYS